MMETSNDRLPPRLFLRFLRWYCNPELLSRIEGDLFEVYHDRLQKSGKRKADRQFVIDVLLLFRPAIIRPLKGYQRVRENFNSGMIKNYFTVAWRNILRHKTFALINVGGLSLGVTCSLLIFLWINDELHVDKFNANKDVYNVYERILSEGKIDAGPWGPGLLAAELKQQIPEIKYATGVWTYGDDILFSLGDKRLDLKGCAADSDFFKIFSYTLLKGNAADALKDPDALAVSRKMAETFFGSVEAAYGSSIRMNNSKDFKITAVFENIPDNASRQFDFVNNWQDLLQAVGWLSNWIYRAPFTYVQLHPGTDPVATEAKIKDFLTPFLTSENGEGYHTELGLQRYQDMYLNSNFQQGVPHGGRIEYVKLFSLIAAFVLLIACINFMNLSTARAVNRAKEVGVRKTMGAFRSYLIGQFIGEAILLTSLAMVLALLFTTLLLPYFNLLTDKHILLPLTLPGFWIGLIALVLTTGLIAGAYPAFFLSGLNSIKILKGSLKANPNALLFRRVLVVFQFILVIAFIAGTMVISGQVNYMQSKNLGFDKENLISIPFQGDLISKYAVFKQQLLTRPGIKNVTRSTNAASDINTHEYDLAWEGKSPDEKVVAIHNGIGYEFLPMMNIPILQGRNFSKEFKSDSPLSSSMKLR